MQCVRCGSKVRLNGEGWPVSHEASHYFGRGKWNVRFDPENVDTLCFACHKIWGSEDKAAYEDYKYAQLGDKRFNDLTLRAWDKSAQGSNYWKKLSKKEAEQVLSPLFARKKASAPRQTP